MESWNRQIDAEEVKARARQAAAEADASSAELNNSYGANAQELRAKVQEGKNFLTSAPAAARTRPSSSRPGCVAVD